MHMWAGPAANTNHVKQQFEGAQMPFKLVIHDTFEEYANTITLQENKPPGE